MEQNVRRNSLVKALFVGSLLFSSYAGWIFHAQLLGRDSLEPMAINDIPPVSISMTTAAGETRHNLTTNGLHLNGKSAIASPVSASTTSATATRWRPTNETQFEVCFLTSVFSTSIEAADHPPDVAQQAADNPTFRYFAFTNLENLDARGWTVMVQNLTQYRRMITRSRWPKFMGWKDPSVQLCQVVFYMDGFCGPKAKHSERYKRLARDIRTSKYGIAQNVHEMGVSVMEEMDRIVEKHKDIASNIEALKRWLLAQSDFRQNCTLYANHYIGYDPRSAYWRNASQFFWDRYSLELDSWRDQPLWCYALDKYHITPMRLGTFQALFREYWGRISKGGHRYGAGADG